MVAGYAAFSTNLEIKGTSKVTSNWDIEITNVTEGIASGSAENTVKPSWDKLWASMEADLYDVGDSMEYDVTIENKGNIDAKLNDILTNVEKENNEAVIITFSGYTKGEILKAGASKQVHVKIEYNPEYEGGETSSEVEINFDYVQNNNETNNPDTQYLITYDYQTNGGTNADIKEEYYASGSNINLENTAYKEGWTFVGWNTDKDANIGLTNIEIKENTTLYAIYSKTLKVTYEKGENVESIGKVEDTCNIYNNQTSCEITLPEIAVTSNYIISGWYKEDNKVGNPKDKYSIKEDTILISKAIEDKIELTISTSATTNSITVIANAISSSGIKSYEYRINNGTWLESKENIHTFENLESGKEYNIEVRAISQTEKEAIAGKTITTLLLKEPIFSEANDGEIVITYPDGCNNGNICTYQYNNGEIITVTDNQMIEVGEDGTIVATISDGINSVSTTYNIIRNNLYVSSNGNDETGYGTKAKPYATLAKAYSSATTTTSSTINIMSNLSINNSTNFDENKNISLTGYNNKNYTLTKEKTFNNAIIELTSGSLKLSNVIIDGNNVQDNTGCIWVYNDIDLSINENTIIQNCYSTSSGGAIRVGRANFEEENEHPKVTINGGKLINNKSICTNCSGGAINLDFYSDLIINSGEISGNLTTAMGGGIYSVGNITLNGGKIINNKSENNTAGISIDNGILVINGGTVKDNKGAGSIAEQNFKIDTYNSSIPTEVYDKNSNFNFMSTKNYAITSALNESYAAVVKNASTNIETPVILYKWSPTQKHVQWKPKIISIEDGVVNYSFEAQHTNDRYLWVSGNSSNTNTQITIANIHTNQGGYWNLISQGDSYFNIKSILGTCMGINGTEASNDINIKAYTCNKQNNQKWKFVATN